MAKPRLKMVDFVHTVKETSKSVREGKTAEERERLGLEAVEFVSLLSSIGKVFDVHLEHTSDQWRCVISRADVSAEGEGELVMDAVRDAITGMMVIEAQEN